MSACAKARMVGQAAIFGPGAVLALVLLLGMAPYAWGQGTPSPKTSTSKSRSAAARKPLPSAARKAQAPRSVGATRRTSTKRTTRAKPSAATLAARRRAAAASAAQREQASAAVAEQLGQVPDTPLLQASALVPFFEHLYRQEQQPGAGPVRILHYGDSHTAADVWTSAIRTALQARFGDGGSGFSHPGAPWRGYRRFDVSSKASPGWQSAGLVGKASLRGDEFQGLSGVSVSTSRAGQWITLEARCSSLEVHYLRQPDGGRFLLYDNDELIAEHATSGELGAGILQLATHEGDHHFRIETVDAAPVRLFGWVAELPGGVTYEPMGINGAQMSIVSRWDPGLFQAYLGQRDPALIVIAYGTNEAGQTVWNYDSYYAEVDRVLKRIRAASPTASLLVVGPPDRMWYLRKRGWAKAPRLDLVIQAQRDAALANQAAFWDTHSRMGGDGSMRRWVQAGLAGRDHVHFSADGYRRLGEVLFHDLMVQYNEFKGLRQNWTSAGSGDPSPPPQPGAHEPSASAHPTTRQEGLKER
ncbi:MAG: SGNH/GDSL hydrolase family protein [Bryobacterales bacterium]|jgi:lysophospholipase L1-like esterase|nr:SGNH/GDSL hydrolase family protein [Bryobacterales bacterium]